MFDFIKRLFGEGKIRVEFTTTEGREGSIVVNYIGDPNTLDLASLRRKIGSELLVQHGLHLLEMEVIGITTN